MEDINICSCDVFRDMYAMDAFLFSYANYSCNYIPINSGFALGDYHFCLTTCLVANVKYGLGVDYYVSIIFV